MCLCADIISCIARRTGEREKEMLRKKNDIFFVGLIPFVICSNRFNSLQQLWFNFHTENRIWEQKENQNTPKERWRMVVRLSSMFFFLSLCVHFECWCAPLSIIIIWFVLLWVVWRSLSISRMYTDTNVTCNIQCCRMGQQERKKKHDESRL